MYTLVSRSYSAKLTRWNDFNVPRTGSVSCNGEWRLPWTARRHIPILHSQYSARQGSLELGDDLSLPLDC